MIKRFLAEKLIRSASQYPVVTVTGPRQSGKTTLVRMVFQHYRYVSLENPDHRNFALTDPRGFLNQFQTGVILDEVQRIPKLFSYIQSIVDEDDQPGKFILTGSQNFLLMGQISQSLAGRTAILHLLPFSLRELSGAKSFHPDNFPDIMAGVSSSDLWENLLTGFYPRIHDKNLDARDWLAGYYQTYVERDVRSVINIGDLETFGRFIRLCAGRLEPRTSGTENLCVPSWSEDEVGAEALFSGSCEGEQPEQSRQRSVSGWEAPLLAKPCKYYIYGAYYFYNRYPNFCLGVI